jgi:hypothetical protein|tara:strand:+ start:151 stop:603 length:453 start_codon:yes stop_codon:yes gene_type:complete
LPNIKINLAKAERKVLPEGDYQARILVADVRTSQRGNPTLHMELVTEGNESVDLDGVRIFRDQGMGEESAYYMAELAKAVYGDVEGDEDSNFEFNTDDMMDVVVGIHISVDASFDGRERNRVDSFFSSDEFGEEEFIASEGSSEGEEAVV